MLTKFLEPEAVKTRLSWRHDTIDADARAFFVDAIPFNSSS